MYIVFNTPEDERQNTVSEKNKTTAHESEHADDWQTTTADILRFLT